MTGSAILARLRDDLAGRIALRRKPPALLPLSISPWLAMALLQKAVRRGRVDLALQAAATLLVDSPERLWRRCGAIAFEDIGLAAPEALGLVTAALGGKLVRAAPGGEWAVASLIVEAMANANKCRAADDLLMSAELHPAFAESRRTQAILSNDELRQIVLNAGVLHKRALALWYLTGADRRPSRYLAMRRGQPNLAFDVLCELGVASTLVETAREGFRKTREILCPLVAFLAQFQRTKNSATKDDDFPPGVMIGQIPSWALDVYSREGRAAYARFLHNDCESARWIRDHVAPGLRVGLLGHVVFRLEGGLVRSRMRWTLAEELRRLVDVDCAGLASREAHELLDLVRADIPILNEVRADRTRDASHH